MESVRGRMEGSCMTADALLLQGLFQCHVKAVTCAKQVLGGGPFKGFGRSRLNKTVCLLHCFYTCTLENPIHLTSTCTLLIVLLDMG